jgi:hypothetical protein
MDEEKKDDSEETVVEPEKEETKVEEKDDFEKDSEVVPVGKYNQAVRKQREIELEKRELEKKLAEKEAARPEPKKSVKEEAEETFFEDEVEEDEPAKVPNPELLIDEKLKPIQEALKKREDSDKKLQRTAFFEKYPQYLNDSEKWQGLLDEMDKSLNPSSGDDYYTQLEKAHRIIAGNVADDTIIEKKKAEMASDASSSGDGAQKAAIKEEFTAEDRKYMETWKISEDGMRAYKKKIAEGSMTVS